MMTYNAREYLLNCARASPWTNTGRGRTLASANTITRGPLPDKGPTPATNSHYLSITWTSTTSTSQPIHWLNTIDDLNPYLLPYTAFVLTSWRLPEGQANPQGSARTTSAVDLEEFCEKHYEKLLPIMADKYEYEKKKKEKQGSTLAITGRKALGHENQHILSPGQYRQKDRDALVARATILASLL
ncbi:hypothetical protein Tco_1333077, partial [Tanacetum coccineum]